LRPSLTLCDLSVLFSSSIASSILFTLLCSFLVTAPSELYPLSLHDALPIFAGLKHDIAEVIDALQIALAPDHILKFRQLDGAASDRKSTRLNSSHVSISYAVFCLKKKKQV